MTNVSYRFSDGTVETSWPKAKDLVAEKGPYETLYTSCPIPFDQDVTEGGCLTDPDKPHRKMYRETH